MRLTDEQIERAKTVNLPQFLMSRGFDLKKVGREYVWKDHDSLHIKDNGPGERGRWYRFSESKGCGCPVDTSAIGRSTDRSDS